MRNAFTLCVMVTAISSLSATAPAAVIDFNTAGEFSSNFSFTTGTNQLGQVLSGGISNSGSVTRSAGGGDVSAVYTAQAFNVSAASGVEVSAFFLRGTNTGVVSPAAMVGVRDTVSPLPLSTDSYLTAMLRANVSPTADQVQLRIAGVSDITLASVTTAPNNWYKLTLKIVRTASANTFTTSVSLDEYDSTGATLLGSLYNASASRTSSGLANLYNDSDGVYVGLRTAGATGTSRVDNFGVTGSPVPEPTSLAAVALMSALVLRRRA